jgi:hypothetical protein
MMKKAAFFESMTEIGVKSLYGTPLLTKMDNGPAPSRVHAD